MLPILVTLGFGVAAALAVRVATRPAIFRVQRSATIYAPPEKIYPLIDDFHRWSSWSPFEELDPAMKRSFSGAERGEGAVYEWNGNKRAGQGRMEITESAPPNRLVIELHFLKPFKSNNICEFSLEQHGDATAVTWAMRGPNTTAAKVMQSVINMDRMVGKDFEAGLAKLKTVAEA